MNKPCPYLLSANALTTPHLAEWWSALFAFGLGIVLILMGDQRLSLGLLQGPTVEGFQQFGLVYSWLMAVGGLIGTVGVIKKHRVMRMTAALILFASLGWLPLYYYWAVPIPWQGVWVYAAHALLEGAIFLRVQHGLDKGWS